MKIETIKKFLDESNWQLGEELDILIEMSGDAVSRGNSLTKKHVMKYFDDEPEILDRLEPLDWEDVKAEMLVRGLIDGWVADEIFP